jgi:F0F1-type ATP synthase membrane subunit b/b'
MYYILSSLFFAVPILVSAFIIDYRIRRIEEILDEICSRREEADANNEDFRQGKI